MAERQRLKRGAFLAAEALGIDYVLFPRATDHVRSAESHSNTRAGTGISDHIVATCASRRDEKRREETRREEKDKSGGNDFPRGPLGTLGCCRLGEGGASWDDDRARVEGMTPPRVFISYAHEDRPWCERLQQHLGGLRHQGRLAVWADDQIMAGDEWHPAIRRELDEAAIIVLIVSPAFLGSAFCQTVELERAMQRHGDGSARVIPIIADHCHWTSLPIEALQARPQDNDRNLVPLVDWPNPNVPMAAIARNIDRLTLPRETSGTAGTPEPAAVRTYLLQRRRTFFIGRDEAKRQLVERLGRGGHAAICGMGGVGKTELALQVAGDLGNDAFPNGIVTVDLQGTPDPTAAASLPLSPEATMQRVLVHLDPTAKPPEDAEAVALAYRRALVGKRLLLILDNAGDQAQVTPLLPPEPVALLVTSRTRIALAEGLTLDLDTLDPADAVELLKEEIGTDRRLDEATLARFAEVCGNLPVALLAIAGTIKTSRTRSPEQLLARLETDRAKGLTAALDRLRPSVEALALDDPDLARYFARLAVFAGDFTSEAVAHVWEVDEDTACDGLDELLARSLLLFAAADGPAPRFCLHDLIREIATERLGGDADAAALRHATYYKNLLAHCDDLYLAGSDTVLEGLALFDRERAEIAAGQLWAAAHAVSHDAAARLAADYPIAGAYGIRLRLESRTQAVWLEVALAANRRLGDRRGEGNTLGYLGLAWADLGELRKAIEFHERALVIARAIGNRRSEGYALGNLGNAWGSLGEPRKAIEYQGQHLAIARAIDDRRGEGNALGNLGNAWADLGEPRKAIECYEQQLAIAREIGNQRGEGHALWNAALANEALGEGDEAHSKAKAAFVIFRAIEEPNAAKVAAWLRERGVDPDRL